MFKKNHLSLTPALFLLLSLTTGCSFVDKEGSREKNFSVTNYGGLQFAEDEVAEKWIAQRFGDAVQLQYFPAYDSLEAKRSVMQIRLEKPTEKHGQPALTDVWFGRQDTLTGAYDSGLPLSGGRVALQSANFEGEMSGLVELFFQGGGSSLHARFWVDLSEVE